ncbi:MAG: hypothetical protein ACXVES_10620 [Actinomycetota bacterium]
MRTTAVSRALAILSAVSLAAGLVMMMSAPATAASRSNAQTSPSASASPQPSPSSSGQGLPGPLASLIPSSSASPSASETASPSDTSGGGGSAQVLGETTVPRTGADRALTLVIAGVVLAATSIAVRRVVAQRN